VLGFKNPAGLLEAKREEIRNEDKRAVVKK